VDADGRPLPAGEIGEVVVAGDHLMLGYWNNPQATASALRDGWLWTGDMGSMDARGYLTLRDRSKDVVISGGSNIYPREVEEALLAHPDVVEVSRGRRTRSRVGRSGRGRRGHAARDDRAVAGRALPGAPSRAFKRPKRYLFADSLPNSYGKVLKREVRLQLRPG
jgi:acyl-CoA synthetase (AMP-forming)/AMP-acid ligase II